MILFSKDLLDNKYDPYSPHKDFCFKFFGTNSVQKVINFFRICTDSMKYDGSQNDEVSSFPLNLAKYSREFFFGRCRVQLVLYCKEIINCVLVVW